MLPEDVKSGNRFRMNMDPVWQEPPASLGLPPGTDVWRGLLDRDDGEQEACARLLDPAERARADRFLVDRERRRWVVARGLLRRILARYARRSPADLRFDVDARGKPSLHGVPSLSFNLSHSGPWMVLAVASGRPVGIDVERIRADRDPADLAALHLTPRERAALAALPPELHPAAWTVCWTRKESVLKALGQGLGVPLETLEVGVGPDPAAGPLPLRGLPMGPEYAATVAGAVDPLRLWDG